MTESGIVLIEASSLNNPLAEAWRLALIAVGIPATGVYTGSDTVLPAGWISTEQAVEDFSPSDVSCLLLWWGIAAVPASHLATRFAMAKAVLVLDTYPNASRLAAELREYAVGLRNRHAIDEVVVATEAMGDMIRKRKIFAPSVRIRALMQPFPLATHCSADASSVAQNSIIFTGRSDYLYSEDRSMRKDAVGPLLQSLVSIGIEVTVSATTEEGYNRFLKRMGLELYPRFSSAQILNGEFSHFVSGFSAQIATYSAVNSTLKRRVRCGLSSRFSLGITSSAPLLVPSSAEGPKKFLEERKIGYSFESASDISNLGARLPQARDAWLSSHLEWSAEGLADDLHSMVRR